MKTTSLANAQSCRTHFFITCTETIPSPVVSSPAGWRTVRVAVPLDKSVREVPEEELPLLWLVGDPFPEAELPPFPVNDIPLSVESLPEKELPVFPLVDCPLGRSIPLPVVPGRGTVWTTGVKLVLVMPP